MRLLLQAFLTRLCVLEGQLTALDAEGKSDLAVDHAIVCLPTSQLSHLLDITFVLLLTMKDGSTPEHQTAGKDTRLSVSPCRGHHLW
jgi:hypothetical protein